MAITAGYQTNWFYAPLDSSGSPVDANEVMIDGVTGNTPLSGTDTPLTETVLAPSGRRPVTEQLLGPRAPLTFSLTMAATGDLSQTALSAANGNGDRVAIRLKQYNRNAEVESTITLICFVNGFSNNPQPDGIHELVAEFGVVTPENPIVMYAPAPFRLGNGDTQAVRLDEVFVGRTPLTYAVGTLDPSSSASASAAYAAGTKTLTITADAARDGTTKIPVNAADANSRTGTFTLTAIVA